MRQLAALSDEAHGAATADAGALMLSYVIIVPVFCWPSW